ncbi:MAG: FkbM family methyltransferase, partial [Betaproteobacteria bacterium]|nr:FkbM family methyltransferase [Betaproteobacteria bacterium]
HSPDGIWLETRLSSAMDLSFLDPRGGGHGLVRDAIANLKPGDRMLDVGANTGFLTLLAARQVGPGGLVIAVEPSLREFQLLLANLWLNRANNVLALNLAGGDQPGVSRLMIEPDHTGLNHIGHREETSIEGQPCQVLPLQLLELGDLALVKIDTEGFELFTLRGLEILLRQQRIRQLVVEISPKFLEHHKQKPEDIYNLMASYGYGPTIGLLNQPQWDELFLKI